MVIAHPRNKRLCDDVGGLVKYEVGTNGVKLREHKRVVLVNPDSIYPCLFVWVRFAFRYESGTLCEVVIRLL
jgi:hypothetical protein